MGQQLNTHETFNHFQLHLQQISCVKRAINKKVQEKVQIQRKKLFSMNKLSRSLNSHQPAVQANLLKKHKKQKIFSQIIKKRQQKQQEQIPQMGEQSNKKQNKQIDKSQQKYVLNQIENISSFQTSLRKIFSHQIRHQANQQLRIVINPSENNRKCRDVEKIKPRRNPQSNILYNSKQKQNSKLNSNRQFFQKYNIRSKSKKPELKLIRRKQTKPDIQIIKNEQNSPSQKSYENFLLKNIKMMRIINNSNQSHSTVQRVELQDQELMFYDKRAQKQPQIKYDQYLVLDGKKDEKRKFIKNRLFSNYAYKQNKNIQICKQTYQQQDQQLLILNKIQLLESINKLQKQQ